MDMHVYYEQFNDCRQKEEPECTNVCPFHLDVLGFQDKMHRHKYDRAYRDYRNAVAFPDIVAALCPEYCHDVCPRKDYDGAVQLNLLEKTCTARAGRKTPTAYNVPKKEGKVGIIGAGISGLACALKLLEKKYEVILFEKSDEVGGQLKDLLPKEVYLTDIDRQLGKEKYEIHANTEINSLDELTEYGFDSIYVATGSGGNDFRTLDLSDFPCYITDDTGKNMAVFAGGSLTGKDVVKSIADGLKIAGAIEIYLQTGKLEYPGKRPDTKVVPNTDSFRPCKPVIPTALLESSALIEGKQQQIFSDEETEIEASRCIRCQCNACWTKCDMVAYLEQWPLSMKEDVAMTAMSTESMIHKTPGIRLINICTQCGLFEEACPPHIEVNNMMLDARKILHKQGKMPPAFHGFWLDDMRHANGMMSKICKNAPGCDESVYAFFPGCHLGAADPRYVTKSYEWLVENFNKMGLILRCCGVPADWAGNEAMHDDQINSLKKDWGELGKPILVTACPSCTRHIKKYIPEIETISIYELMEKNDKWPHANHGFSEEFSLFDPCAARNDEGIKNAVRSGLKCSKTIFDELPTNGKNACCGYGGNVEIADPGFAKYVAEQRIGLSDKSYITYCANCRDIFLEEGKPALHMLDVLFDINESNAQTPNLTERRENREKIKKSLLKVFWSENMVKETGRYEFEIDVPDNLREKMDSLRLVDDDIREVIDRSNRINRRTYDSEADEYICYAKLNYITCWVRYKKIEDIYHIKNIYTHRMDIKLEGVFNGRKIETDM